jgi:hypothetical protein
MDELRGRVQEGIRNGRLPKIDCLVTWFGIGRGQICAACASRILGSEVAVECELPDWPILWFHARCYDVWLAARRPRDTTLPGGA